MFERHVLDTAETPGVNQKVILPVEPETTLVEVVAGVANRRNVQRHKDDRPRDMFTVGTRRNAKLLDDHHLSTKALQSHAYHHRQRPTQCQWPFVKHGSKSKTCCACRTERDCERVARIPGSVAADLDIASLSLMDALKAHRPELLHSLASL